MTEPFKVTSFKLPISLKIPFHEIEDIRKKLNSAITGSEDPINIQLDNGHFIPNPKFSQFQNQLRSAHWMLNASQPAKVSVSVYSDGTMEIE